jgi:hypothetical protein
MSKLTIKYSILALNPVSRKKLADYWSKITVYRSKKRFTSGFLFYYFFNFFTFKTNFEKNQWLTENAPDGFGKPTGLPPVFIGSVNHAASQPNVRPS